MAPKGSGKAPGELVTCQWFSRLLTCESVLIDSGPGTAQAAIGAGSGGGEAGEEADVLRGQQALPLRPCPGAAVAGAHGEGGERGQGGRWKRGWRE